MDVGKGRSRIWTIYAQIFKEAVLIGGIPPSEKPIMDGLNKSFCRLKT